jgi:hypothetical protein
MRASKCRFKDAGNWRFCGAGAYHRRVAEVGWHCRTDNVAVGAIPYGGFIAIIAVDVLENVDSYT